MSWNEQGLFGYSVHNHKNRSVVAGGRELMDEIHGYGIPRFGQDRELLQVSIWFVLGGFGSSTGCA